MSKQLQIYLSKIPEVCRLTCYEIPISIVRISKNMRYNQARDVRHDFVHPAHE